MFSDDVKMRKLNNDGSYLKVPNVKGINAQEVLISRAIERTKEAEDRRHSEKNKINIGNEELNLKEELEKQEEKDSKREKESIFKKIISIFRK